MNATFTSFSSFPQVEPVNPDAPSVLPSPVPVSLTGPNSPEEVVSHACRSLLRAKVAALSFGLSVLTFGVVFGAAASSPSRVEGGVKAAIVAPVSTPEPSAEASPPTEAVSAPIETYVTGVAKVEAPARRSMKKTKARADRLASKAFHR